MKTINKSALAAGIGLGWLLAASNAFAAPGVLSQIPLFVGSNVQPNILLLLDDSGSMDWEVLKTNGAIAAHPNVNDFPADWGILVFPPGNDRQRLELCAGYNAMAYNPANTYTPWAGIDTSGNPLFTDRTLTTARSDPMVTTDINITTHAQYYVWNDDGDGVYQSGECPVDLANQVLVNTLSLAEQTNYANWYTYYRKREYVAKRALTEIIMTSQARMGLATLRNNNSAGRHIRNIDDITMPMNATNRTNKISLLNGLLANNPAGGTPLRLTLRRAGQYFNAAETTPSTLFGYTPSPPKPILSAALGGQCQKNFSVLMSDGYWNGESPSLPSSNSNADGNNNTAWDGGSHADNVSNTLADVAMHYYETDLSLALPNVVGTQTGIDENPAQHMVTYTVAFGVDGTLTENPPNRTASFSWPTPVANTATTIDDMRHAAWNSRGLFLNAKDPAELVEGLTAAIVDIESRDGAASAIAFNTTSIRNDTLLFQAKFNPETWSGDLTAYSFANGVVGPEQWAAAGMLSARTADRQIITSKGNYLSVGGTVGIPFVFPANYNSPLATELAPNQINDLIANRPFPSPADATQIAANQAFGEGLVGYLRGDSSNEGTATGNFRRRSNSGASNPLGDIIHSSPQFVGVPDAAYPNWMESVAYSVFRNAESSRQPMVYVGANDGMLHGFNATNGEEVFAYIPGALFSSQSARGLHYLAQQNYVHMPYVDESPFATDVFDGVWRTYLAGAYRAGGKGIYVLDITDPSALTEANAANVVKLEFTHPDLGYGFSRPLMGKMNNGKWAVVFGNGYNNDPSGDGRAKLFIVYLDGSGYRVIDTQQGVVVAGTCNNNVSSDCNGLSSPILLDLTGDAVIDRAYAGDLHGNMWAFDLTSATDTDWDVAYASGGSPIPLFRACTAYPCTRTNRQPITTMPDVDQHPYRTATATDPNLLVFFGTGQYIAAGDQTTTAQQSMYGVWDAGASNVTLTRNHLQQQVISNSAIAGVRDITSNAVSYTSLSSASPELGWYVNLPTPRERVVVQPIVSGRALFYNTAIPDVSPCNNGGSGHLMFVDRLTGGRATFPIRDVNGDNVIDSNDIGAGVALNALPGQSIIIDDVQVTQDSLGVIMTDEVMSDSLRQAKRSSWAPVR